MPTQSQDFENLNKALENVAPHWPADLRTAVAARGTWVRCSDGARLFGPGDRCTHFIIPVSGTIRVEHMGATGRSVVLYRVGPGESCVMTTSCLLSGSVYEAYGFADGDVRAIGMAASCFQKLVDDHPDFRALALSVFSQRIIELVEVIDELLLHRVDVRLAAWLAERKTDGRIVHATHQTIAAELGTAREVVSRILKDFERRGWINLNRGEIKLIDIPSLVTFARAR